jgi:hypothetical protein
MTTVTLPSDHEMVFDTKEERDQMMEAGAKSGYDEAMQRLAALLRAAAKLA